MPDLLKRVSVAWRCPGCYRQFESFCPHSAPKRLDRGYACRQPTRDEVRSLCLVMRRQPAGFILLVLAGVALVAFYITMANTTDITKAEVILSGIATLGGGWGIALLLPDRYRRWAVRYMAVITLPIVFIAVILGLAVSN